jgi:hypothetical protein
VDDFPDSGIPATVVCAHCGDAECPGCLHEQTKSGVVAVVPWERPGSGALARLWSTARATALDADRFFESLPDGSLAPALRFALITELFAATFFALLGLVPLVVLAPRWVEHLVTERGASLVRFALVGVPALAALLVASHAAHGWALDLGARRVGARGATTRALRFGLYACGWDLVVGPIGAVVLVLREGGRAALRLLEVGPGLPGRSARAFLRGCYRLDGESTGPALRASYSAAVVATLVCAIAVVTAAVLVLLL